MVVWGVFCVWGWGDHGYLDFSVWRWGWRCRGVGWGGGGVLQTGYLVPVRVCLLVAVGRGGCWLVAVAVAVVAVTPKILQVDILVKVLSST